MDVNLITKVAVFDFDGTLIHTLEPEEGKKIWKEKTGEDYPHRGWWGRRETLDINVFDNEPFPDIESIYRKEASNENTYVSLCTGRIVPLTNEVKAILDKYNLIFDDVILNGDKRFQDSGGHGNDTLAFKIRYLASLQKTFPNLKVIEFWDDRREHHSTFKQWALVQPIDVIIHLVH